MGVGFDTAEISDSNIRLNTSMQHLLANILQGSDWYRENNKFRVLDGKGEIVGDLVETGGPDFCYPFDITSPKS